MQRPTSTPTVGLVQPDRNDKRRTHPGRRMPERLGPGELRAFTEIDSRRAWLAIIGNWATIAAAVTTALVVDNIFVTLLAIAVIGSRQMALTIVGHEAAHFLLFKRRAANEWIGNLLVQWPVFISVEGFRHYHVEHHRSLEDEGDGNRELWNTHKNGERTSEWTYPKTYLGLAAKVLWRASGPTGVWWMVRGLLGGFLFRMPLVMQLCRISFYAGLVATAVLTGTWFQFLVYWVIPFTTWQVGVQYLRLICEHSNTDRNSIQTEVDADYTLTRSTHAGWFARIFFLPHNVGYHLEHHGYPGVPFYNLPKLHNRLMDEERFAANANVHRTMASSLAECTEERVLVLPNGRES